MDFQKKAEKVFGKLLDALDIEWDYDEPEIEYITTVLEQAYREGVEAMRDAVPWHERSFKEQIKKIATRLLSKSEEVKK